MSPKIELIAAAINEATKDKRKEASTRGESTRSQKPCQLKAEVLMNSVERGSKTTRPNKKKVSPIVRPNPGRTLFSFWRNIFEILRLPSVAQVGSTVTPVVSEADGRVEP